MESKKIIAIQTVALVLENKNKYKYKKQLIVQIPNDKINILTLTDRGTYINIPLSKKRGLIRKFKREKPIMRIEFARKIGDQIKFKINKEDLLEMTENERFKSFIQLRF